MVRRGLPVKISPNGERVEFEMKNAGWTMKKLMLRSGLGYGRAVRLALLVTMALAFELHPITALAAPTITYVQGNYATPKLHRRR